MDSKALDNLRDVNGCWRCNTKQPYPVEVELLGGYICRLCPVCRNAWAEFARTQPEYHALQTAYVSKACAVNKGEEDKAILMLNRIIELEQAFCGLSREWAPDQWKKPRVDQEGDKGAIKEKEASQSGK